MSSSIIVIACPGKKIRLSKIDPGETGGVTKEEALERMGPLHQKLSLLQQALYAEHRRGVLIIFQALDTGGENCGVKKLCAGRKPAGGYVTRCRRRTMVGN